MKMNLKNIIDYCKRNGVVVYEKHDPVDRRKRYYTMVIPVFVGDEVVPSGNREYSVKTPVECYRYVHKLLDDDLFRRRVAAWVRTW